MDNRGCFFFQTNQQESIRLYCFNTFCYEYDTVFYAYVHFHYGLAATTVRSVATARVIADDGPRLVQYIGSNGGSIGETVGVIALPLVWSLKRFFGNHFSQFVVIFLVQGLRNSFPITNLSPKTVNVSAQFALTNHATDNDTHTCISTL